MAIYKARHRCSASKFGQLIRLCFVCLGNICRSPTAEGVMLHLIQERGLEIEVDSAGTGGYHIGEPADSRSIQAARRRGVHLPSRARQFKPEDFARFDYVLAMDTANLEALKRLGGEKVHLLRDFDPDSRKAAAFPTLTMGATRASKLCSTSALRPAEGCSTI